MECKEVLEEAGVGVAVEIRRGAGLMIRRIRLSRRSLDSTRVLFSQLILY